MHPDLRRLLKARLLALPPRAFELFAGDLLTFMGLSDVAVTRYSGDGGIDATASLQTGAALISIPIGVQVKRHRNNVGRTDIDRFVGALSGHYPQGIFITTAGYSPQAIQKAASTIPRVATINGDQVVALMLEHRLGIVEGDDGRGTLDEQYFAQFEAHVAQLGRIGERQVEYRAGNDGGREARPEDDLVSLRGLSHALRVDTTTLRRWIESGRLRPEQLNTPQGGYLFRRDKIETIRADLLGRTRPADPEGWRAEFLSFARSRNLTKSYKPVLLKALLLLVDRNGEAHIDELVAAFRAFYRARREAGLLVEFGPPDPSDSGAVSDAQLRHLIVRHPLERFLIKGFLEYLPNEGVVRFAPQLWAELRAWELLDLQQSADEQIRYYYEYRRGSPP